MSNASLRGSSGSSSMAIGGAVTGGTVGSVLFIGAGGVLQQDNPNFFWDNTTNRLGIGTSTPTNYLQVAGLINFDDTTGTCALGSQALFSNTTGFFNTAVGFQALYKNVDGLFNFGMGFQALYENISGTNNTAVGAQCLSLSTGSSNVVMGATAFYRTTGDANVGIGDSVGYFITGGHNVCLGNYAGFYETGSDSFYLDSYDRSNLANGKTQSLMYGTFHSTTPNNQTLRFNAKVGISTTPSQMFTLPAGTATAGTAPLKFTSGTSLTTPVAGVMEFTTDNLFFTITTGAARKAFILDDGARLTSGRVPFATTNGRLTDDPDMTFATDTLTVTGLAVGTAKIKNYNNIATEGYGVPAIPNLVALTAQTADVASTNFTNCGTAGLYRINYYLENTTADVTAGTVTLVVSFTDAAGATSVSSSALTLTILGRTSGIFFVQLASGNISYTTTHTGVFGTSQFALYMIAERIN